MCKYCEIEKIGCEAIKAIRKNKRMNIQIITHMMDMDTYYLKVNPKGMTGECIDIKYCPFCGGKLGE